MRAEEAFASEEDEDYGWFITYTYNDNSICYGEKLKNQVLTVRLLETCERVILR